MKRVCAGFLIVFLLTSPSYAYLYEIPILKKAEIANLTDDGLIDAYINVVVEFEAAKAFHYTSGFSPKEYAQYKELIKYKILLRQEIQKRKLDLPPIEDKTSDRYDAHPK